MDGIAEDLQTQLLGHVSLLYPDHKSVELKHAGALVLTGEGEWITIDQQGRSFPHPSRDQAIKFLFDVAVDYEMDRDGDLERVSGKPLAKTLSDIILGVMVIAFAVWLFMAYNYPERNMGDCPIVAP